jgi:hypothetical protein
MSPESAEPEPESFGQRRVVRTLRAKVTFARRDKMLKKLVSNKDAQSFSNSFERVLGAVRKPGGGGGRFRVLLHF